MTMTIDMPISVNRPPGPDERTELVSPWTVLMAVRYGLGRLTYAHKDAVSLMVRHWPAIKQFAPSIMADLQFIERNALTPDIRQSAQDMIAWVEMQALVDAEQS